MENICERLVGDYLGAFCGCDFISYNLRTPDVQGEIDVVAVATAERRVYLCEVVAHLETGMMYVHPVTRQTDNVARFLRKFEKNIAYARKAFADYDHHFMIWSPVVRSSGPGARHDQMRDLDDIRDGVRSAHGVEVEIVCNDDFLGRIDALRAHALRQTAELKSPVLRLFQIEEKLKRHLARAARAGG